jgi:hypothetical protein
MYYWSEEAYMQIYKTEKDASIICLQQNAFRISV